jgi:glycosyltransferase involved in cell wall biosynthesis
MRAEPKITVITIVLNKKQELERTIQSVITQSYRNIEYAVIDGGSTDGTVGIIHKYRHHIDHRVIETDHGIYDAMNKGIRLARGELLVFLNGGDEFLEKDSVALIVDAYLKQNKPDVICGGTCLRYPRYNADKMYHPLLSQENLSKGFMPHQSATFVKSSVFSQIGAFNTQYRVCADFDFICRLFFSKFTAAHVERTTTVFYSGGISSDKKLTYKELYTIIKNFFGSYPAYAFMIRRIIIEQGIKRILKYCNLLDTYYKRFYFR